MTLDVTVVGVSSDTPVINYTPDAIDEYMVIVNLPEDWEVVHNYIINENEIDGIPNRKVECSNDQSFSLRTSIYMMSAAEAEVLKTHPRVETVELNPDKYPQPQSLGTYRYRKNVAFNKPLLTNGQGSESTGYTNGVRSNWSHLFLTNPTSTPYKGVGITTTDTTNSDVIYSLTGKHVDAVTIDTGVGILHPEFIGDDGTYRVQDVILDGPYKVDPAAFSGYTSSVTIDGVNIGTRADESRARSWWSNTGIRSAAFQSLGTVTISSSYTRIHAHSKNGTGAVTDSHGTSCASQIGGKSFGLAIEANLWNIRINLGEGGIIGGSTSLNICTIWHNAKKINSGNPDPTILNNSWGSFSSTGNSSGSSYGHVYRGQSLTYTGSGSGATIPANSGSCRNNKYFTAHLGSGYSTLAYSGDGQYTLTGSTTNTAAENAIAAGVIVVSAAGNTNQKLSDKNDIDFDNLYGGFAYVNRVGGVQQGFSGDHERSKGVIRVGALDCGVEPYDSSGGLSKQGVAGYSIRKVVYSANGPMIDIWAPAEFTMSAAYASGEDLQRQDNGSFYDHWFNGTSSACPNTVSLLCLFLESNRSANQDVVRHWLDTSGSTPIALSDPYPELYQEGYWSLAFNATYDAPSKEWDGYNIRGNGNLRGASNKVLANPYASNTQPSINTSNANQTYEINVTNSGSGAYTLSGADRNGTVSGNNQTITINDGDTLKFIVNANGHPFWINTTNTTGTSNGVAGVTNNGTQSGTVTWDTASFGGTFYYNCQYHSGMNGTITVNVNNPNETYEIDVTNSGSGAYTLSGTDRNGTVSGNNSSVSIFSGDILKFEVVASGHPFWIKTVNSTGTSNGVAGVTNNGTDSGTVTWDSSSFGGTFYYNCQYHSGMNGTIMVNVNSSTDPTKITSLGSSNQVVAGLKLHTHTNDIVLGTEPPPPPTYSISQTATSINEGGNIVYTVTTTNVTNGTTLYWSLAGTAVAADFNPASLTGSFTVSGNSGTFTVTVATDAGSDGGETFTASVRTGSTSGTVVATASQVTITDVPPVPTYSVSQDTTTVVEGNSVVYTLSTTYVSNGTTLYWSLAGTAVAADFDPASLTGSFSVSSNSGTFTVTTATDAATEGNETFTASIRTGSTSGTVVATASQVTITNVAPPPSGQEEWITAGTYTWTCPAGVTSVCVVCIGGGGTGGAYGGSGGSLAYKNNISVTPGNTYTIVVGATNTGNYASPYSFDAENTSALGCVAHGGIGGYSGYSSGTRRPIGPSGSSYDGGGRGGLASADFYQSGIGYKGGAGGGAGGYGGDGGDAGKGAADGTSGSAAATAGSAGGGGGGAPGNSTNNEGGGGGTGIYGQGTSGAAAGGNNDRFGKGGSGGADGTDPYGGQHGGGSGAIGSGTPSSTAQCGAVRIIWGTGRAYPSTNTADVLTPWFDLDNMSFTGKGPNYRWRAQTTNNTNGVYLKPDGTILYILSADRKIRRHNLSTAYDLGTASYHSVSSALSTTNGMKGGLFFKSDGTKLFYIDYNYVRAYSLSSAWDITTMSGSGPTSDDLLLSSLNSSSNGSSISFKPDGSKIYVSEGPSGNSDIHQWSLSTSWDLSTASYGNVSPSFTGSQQNNILGFSWKADGTEIIVTHGSYYIGRWPISTAWDITTRGSQTSVSAFYQVVEGMTGLGMNIQWKSDGTVAFVPYKLQTMAQLEPSSAWTLSSVSDNTPGDQAEYVKWHTRLGNSGVYCNNWSSDGMHLYIVGGGTSIQRNSVTTAYDIKTITNSYAYGTLYGTGYGTYDFKFNSTGEVLLVVNTWSQKKAFQYSLSTPFDITTISSSYTDLDLTSGSGSSSFSGGCISDDGKYLYMNNSSTLYQWTLSTPFSLSTASFTRSQGGFSFGGWDGMAKISPDGKHLITHNNQYSPGYNEFKSYELTTAWDISTRVYKKTAMLHEKAPHAPLLVHSAGWTIANGSWFFNVYYDYAALQIDF